MQISQAFMAAERTVPRLNSPLNEKITSLPLRCLQIYHMTDISAFYEAGAHKVPSSDLQSKSLSISQHGEMITVLP